MPGRRDRPDLGPDRRPNPSGSGQRFQGARPRPGKRRPGGGPTGDLFISIEVTPHPLFKRQEATISLKVPVTVPEATLGGKIEVPTLWGKTTIRIPPGTRSGQKFRIKGEGAPLPGKKVKGDELVEVFIVTPPFENQRIRDIMKELEQLSGPNPRENLGMK